MLHEEGASTDSTGTLVFSIAVITSLKGSRTSPEKLNPVQDELQPGDNLFRSLTKNCVNDVVSALQRRDKVFGEWHGQILQLRG